MRYSRDRGDSVRPLQAFVYLPISSSAPWSTGEGDTSRNFFRVNSRRCRTFGGYDANIPQRPVVTHARSLNPRTTPPHRAQSAILTLFISPCLAQVESGTIAGTVTDATGAVIPDAAVTVSNVASNVKRITQTSGTGSYSVVGLAPAPTRSRSIQGSSSLTPPTSRSPWVAM